MVIALLVAGGSASAAPSVKPSVKTLQHQPMIFFVAKGAPDACGPGCSEWIAAEGTFDPEAHRRLRGFLNSSSRKTLPIFFHSPGGIVGPSIGIGLILRELRMTAGVGQTIPEGCREAPKADEACRKLMRTGGELKARLRLNGAACASACVYALVGASVRQVAPGARLAVHANSTVQSSANGRVTIRMNDSSPADRAKVGRTYDNLRQYVTRMGVDPALIDLAARTNPRRLHWLSRDEMARFGILPGDYFETPWRAHVRPDFGYFILKAVTRPSPSNRSEYRTATIEFSCYPGSNIIASIRRELATNERGSKPIVRITSGADVVVVFDEQYRSGQTLDFRSKVVPTDAVTRAAVSDAIVFREITETGSRETKLSTQGLSDALKAIPERCGGKV